MRLSSGFGPFKKHNDKKGTITINHLIPYKQDVDPRIVDFLRDFLICKLNGDFKCKFIHLIHRIWHQDWRQICFYINKYDIQILKRLIKVDRLNFKNRFQNHNC